MVNVIRLRDYEAPHFSIESVHLHVDINDDVTRVKSKLKIHRRAIDENAPLVLNGDELTLKSIDLDGKKLKKSDYQITPTSLTIPNVPKEFILETIVEIKPQLNTALSGLYLSKDIYCTQCEAQGFRRITYYLDRPDVMALFKTTIIADKKRFPNLLSNGNLIDSKDLSDGRHSATWEDPFKKPCYLFALVAGNLGCMTDFFTAPSGRKIELKIYVEPGNETRCTHAMEALKKAMTWDQHVYAREYDLDIYMIFAARDFNMGAMENKGLNIFNDKYILARPDIATDEDFKAIDMVVGHEYFHNWTGNRITCRDWFQLSLKEGLTVFREQQFTADHYPPIPERITQAQHVRTHQFPEDAGPMAHPVQPRSYIEINNFYTATVYEKGAEVIRMLHTLLTPVGFLKGMAVYFAKYDGQAVTIQEFVGSMEEANNYDLSQFMLWYKQAGTPTLHIAMDHHLSSQTVTMTIEQTCPPTPGQSEKKPLHIPLKMALLDAKGKEIPLQLEGESAPSGNSRLLEIKNAKETFIFKNVTSHPIPSLLRDFSAPVKIDYNYSADDLIFLMMYDNNGFSQWEAMQTLGVKQILELVNKGEIYKGLLDAYEKILLDFQIDPALKAKLLTLPSLTYLCEFVNPIDIDALYEARSFLRKKIAEHLKVILLEKYEQLFQESSVYRFDSDAVAARQLKNILISLATWNEAAPIYQLCLRQYQKANNMTDRIAAFACLTNHDCKERATAVTDFYDQWKKEPLVIDQWFSIQATSELPTTLKVVQELSQHSDFTLTNPNRVRALIGSFCQGNLIRFHDKSGEGYKFLADFVLQLDPLNPQVAARLLTAMSSWFKFETERKRLMHEQLERIQRQAKLSKDTFEIVSKYLKAV